MGLPAMDDADRATRAIARSGGSGHPLKVRKGGGLQLYQPIDPLASLGDMQKVKLLERLEQLCRARDPRVIQVMATLGAEYEVVLVARSDGVQAADVRPLVRLSVQVIVEQNGRREQGTAGGGGRSDYSHFTEDRLQEYAKQAVDQALVNLESRPAPAGTMTVVLGPGWPGILLHEAIGHGLEGDFNRKGSSAFAGKIGKKVAARGVTVVDDGTIPGRRGSLSIENGKITYPVKGATLIGNGPDVLTRVSMIGNDLALDTGVGTCGKEGQSVPVGVGQPTLRIDGLTVGGTA